MVAVERESRGRKSDYSRCIRSWKSSSSRCIHSIQSKYWIFKIQNSKFKVQDRNQNRSQNQNQDSRFKYGVEPRNRFHYHMQGKVAGVRRSELIWRRILLPNWGDPSIIRTK